MLYRLSSHINPNMPGVESSRFAFLTGILHIISPAGLFLSAPYAESPFSFLNFTGFFFYTRSHQIRLQGRDGIPDLLLLASGITFGLASVLRSNGLLSGLIFCYEAVNGILALSQLNNFGRGLRRLLLIFMAGSIMALGPFLPQYLAYRQYCVPTEIIQDRRPWCSNWVPSVYAWVQEFYW